MRRTPVRVARGAGDVPEGWTVLSSAACPCCVGRVKLQVDLVQLLREESPGGVLIPIEDPSHAAQLRRALREWPLSDYVVVMPD